MRNARRRGGEVVELGDVGVGQPVQAAADALERTLGFETLKRRARDADLRELARARDSLAPQ